MKLYGWWWIISIFWNTCFAKSLCACLCCTWMVFSLISACFRLSMWLWCRSTFQGHPLGFLESQYEFHWNLFLPCLIIKIGCLPPAASISAVSVDPGSRGHSRRFIDVKTKAWIKQLNCERPLASVLWKAKRWITWKNPLFLASDFYPIRVIWPKPCPQVLNIIKDDRNQQQSLAF